MAGPGRPHVLGASASRSAQPFTLPLAVQPQDPAAHLRHHRALVYRVSAGTAARDFLDTVLASSRPRSLTVVSVLALAYVMNLSGQTITIGTWIRRHRRLLRLPFPGPGLDRHRRHRVDTSANALFAKLQATAGAKAASTDPAGLRQHHRRVVGKMVSRRT